MADPYIGEIRMVGFYFAPHNFAYCDGQVVPISQNQALYSLLGTYYGGDGRQTFAYPDFRGRAPVHQGQGPQLSNYNMGQKAGTETYKLTVEQMPVHSHSATLGTMYTKTPASTNAATSATPGKDNKSVLAAGNYKKGKDLVNVNMYNTTQNCTLVQQPMEGSVSVSKTGAGADVYNLSPYLTINFVIALDGTYPSRN